MLENWKKKRIVLVKLKRVNLKHYKPQSGMQSWSNI